ncbi:hypothetical protein KVR01_000270 [Diaporthe batatas]|uniref:uncharacterized protein n=1 Tax=Diaporthe batatas TaxID=748121 RepID=UPI001D04491F|nr:uncharacterized protein KVR01_000270 [Diaporthe batatas]KAG8169525.1 hypothetical protein KVR01_000270 [Diaporthe batatas]
MSLRGSLRPSDASTTSSAGASSQFKDSLQEELELWCGAIPLEDNPSFRSLVNSPQDAKSSVFEPREQHCGMWKDAPNSSCHASFGNQGTTASVSCFGNFIQINQFLGAGHSGIFSMDHINTDVPYYVSERASDLDALGSENVYPSLGVYLPKAYRPNRAPEMKWVNWRWPRYECKLDIGFNLPRLYRRDCLSKLLCKWLKPSATDSSIQHTEEPCMALIFIYTGNVLENDTRPIAKVTVQFFVKDNIVFQQFVVTNTGSSPIENFRIRAGRAILIRDLDYLDEPSYNDNDSKSYIRGPGPNGFSWITVNVIDSEKSGSTTGVATGAIHVESNSNHAVEGLQQHNSRTEAAGNEASMSPPRTASGETIRRHRASGQTNVELDISPASDQVEGVRKQASIDQQNLNSGGNKTCDQLQEKIPNKSKQPPSDTELWQQREISDTWTTKDAHAVVSVMSLFVNGTAQKMGMGRYKSHRTIGASGSSSSVLKITAAYKMIVIPDRKVHWKNFLIPAEISDVDAKLAAESEGLWDDLGGGSNSYSLRDIGICTKGGYERDLGQDTGGLGQKPERFDSEGHGAMNIAMKDETATSTDSKVAATTGGRSAAAESSNKHRSSQDTSARPHSGTAIGTSQKVPVINSIEYLTWRHTEHILSVCMLPLLVPLLLEEDSSGTSIQQSSADMNIKVNTSGNSNPAEVEHDVPVALTCGDMSGHRICTSASFFAFEFLVDVLGRLEYVEQAPYILSLRGRIMAACRGHIKWLEWVRKAWLPLHQTHSLLESGCFAANYWVNGQIMHNLKNSVTWQPDDAITDTPFQILKVTAYVKLLRTVPSTAVRQKEELRHPMALLRDVWACLITELDDLDKRKACAWRHKSENGLNTYRLDDHFWLWNSLAELHSLGLWSLVDANGKSWEGSPDRWMSKIFPSSTEVKQDEESSTDDSENVRHTKSFANFVSKARRLMPKEVQRAVLQRFTVENNVSGERMLAVTRSARETRFFFHARDTALFYGHKRGFFRPETAFSDLWERTIKCQSHHEEALQEGWHSPLRFALGAVAGLNGFSIDKRDPDELVRQSVEALIRTSSQNASIPGEMDAVTREPLIFKAEEDRDYYYHVGFESCRILLEYGRRIETAFRSEQTDCNSPAAKQTEGDSRQFQSQREMVEILLNEMLAQPKKQSLTKFPHGGDYKALSKLSGVDARFDRKRISMVMKKFMPFNSMIDASSITPLDEEWLYNYPDFLLVKDIDLQDQLKKLFSKYSKRYLPQIHFYGSESSIIDKALEALGNIAPNDFSIKGIGTDKWIKDGMVAGLPKQKSLRENRRKWSIGATCYRFSDPFNKCLWDSISKERSAVTAKKRFLWLPARSNPETALLCWLASTDTEKPAISLFFDRHAGYDNHLWDDTTMVMNTWQTELHLCFWLIYNKSDPLHQGLPHPIVAPWPRGNDKEFRRASIGFRFNGDFFDRYWTGYFIQYIPGLSYSWGIPLHWTNRFIREKESWQRKVLELQLLQHILNLILTSSNKILHEIEAELGIKKGILIFSVLTSEAYTESANHWQIYEELLEKAEDDILSSLNTLSKWASREHDRGQERPRWTRNDETKYRGSINKLRNQTERQRWDLESSREKMCKLRETLATRQAKIRSDLEAKREQNIRYFTYVTVIFLPLGFASSFYSMNGPPSNDLIISLAKFAAAALAVTAVFLFIAGTLIALGGKALTVVKHLVLTVKNYSISMVNRAILLPLQRYSRGTRENSLLFKGVSADKQREEALHKAYPKQDWMVSSWFWPAYLLLELPTRMISSALTAVRTGTLSPAAVWKVAIGITVLPVYGLSRAVLFLFSNIVVLLRILKHLYRLSKKELSKDDKKGASESKSTDAQIPQTHMGDSEKNTAGQSTLPDDFSKLMPTAKPLISLQTLELRLKQRLEKVEAKQDTTMQREGVGR